MKSSRVSFLLEIALKDYQANPEKTAHECTFSKWAITPNDKKVRKRRNVEPESLYRERKRQAGPGTLIETEDPGTVESGVKYAEDDDLTNQLNLITNDVQNKEAAGKINNNEVVQNNQKIKSDVPITSSSVVSKDKRHIEKCSVQIVSEPNGLFSEHCDKDNVKSDDVVIRMEDEQTTSSNMVSIRHNKGIVSLYFNKK